MASSIRKEYSLPVPETIQTRPEKISAGSGKCGSSGSKVQLLSNYFRLNQLPDFEFIQYRVDFEPDIEFAGLRKAFIYQHQSDFGG